MFLEVQLIYDFCFCLPLFACISSFVLIVLSCRHLWRTLRSLYDFRDADQSILFEEIADILLALLLSVLQTSRLTFFFV